MKANKDYEKRAHKILKTYNSILVKCKNLPILSDKNIVIVENMDSMVNAQIETRKPILYFQEIQSISFILLDGTECYVYILKANENITTELEHTIENFEIARNTFVKEILSKIEKVLLAGNNQNKNLLTENELKYLENMKEDVKFKKDTNTENINNGTETKLTNENEENKKSIIKDESKSSSNLYLVPVKKKFNFFRNNKKAKRLSSRKNERRRKIV